MPGLRGCFWRYFVVLKSKRYFWLLQIPALALVFLFTIYPLVRTFMYSFTNWRNFSPKQTFIGFRNYAQILNDRIIFLSLRNTFIMMFFVFLFQMGAALLLAILVDSAKRLSKFFRTVFFFPILISATAIGLMFRLMYTYDYGLLNYFATLLGHEKQVWLTEKSSIFFVSIPIMWQYVGFYFVIFMAGISRIPLDIYESVELDGIGPVQKVVYITIPMMRDVLTASAVLIVSGCFKIFDMVYMISNGGPVNSSEILSTYMYSMAFINSNSGYASAIAIVMILLGTGLTVVMQKIFEQKDD
jgi:raffinose/stachyose/melibiose transport system permease protein